MSRGIGRCIIKGDERCGRARQRATFSSENGPDARHFLRPFWGLSPALPIVAQSLMGYPLACGLLSEKNCKGAAQVCSFRAYGDGDGSAQEKGAMGEHLFVENHREELERTRQSVRRLEKLLCRSEAAARRPVGVGELEKAAGEIVVIFEHILSTVAGYGRILHGEMGRKDTLRKYAGLILAHAEAGKHFANKLVSMGEKRRVSPRSIDVNRLIGEMSRLLSGVMKKKGIQLRTVLAEGELTVMADPTQIGWIFVGLAGYLGEMVAGGGTMTVMTRLVPVENRITGAGGVRGCALLSFRSGDVARPMPSRREVSRIDAKKPVPLAVSAIRRIIGEHRGAMRIRGQRGRTLEFNIYLPVVHLGGKER